MYVHDSSMFAILQSLVMGSNVLCQLVCSEMLILGNVQPPTNRKSPLVDELFFRPDETWVIPFLVIQRMVLTFDSV